MGTVGWMKKKGGGKEMKEREKEGCMYYMLIGVGVITFETLISKTPNPRLIK